jgi:hypothetical protein
MGWMQRQLVSGAAAGVDVVGEGVVEVKVVAAREEAAGEVVEF